MRLSNLRYFLAEGWKSFWVNGLMSAASVMIVTASLIIFGIYLLFSYNLNFIGQQFQSQYEIRVYLNDQMTKTQIEKLGVQITQVPYVAGATFFSKEEALADSRKQLKDKASILDGFEADNPMRNCYKVTLTDLLHAEEVGAAIREMTGVAEVEVNQDITDTIVSITTVVRNVSMWLVVLLSIIAVFIISNTIKLTVFARRRDIVIMKYLGATDWFISWPFVIEGIVIGIIGAFVSLALVSGGYGYVAARLQDFLGNEVRLYSVMELLWYTVAWFMGIGVMLGALGSAISLRRHLHV